VNKLKKISFVVVSEDEIDRFNFSISEKVGITFPWLVTGHFKEVV